MALSASWRQKQLAEINRFAREVRAATPVKLEHPLFLKLAFTLFEALVIGNEYGNPTGTPVKTGHARAQWTMSFGAPLSVNENPDDPTGQITMAREMTRLLDPKMLAVNPIVYFTNGAPYAIRLEYGWSDQAPSGMVRIVVSNYDRLVSDVMAWAKANEPRLAGAEGDHDAGD